MPFIENPAISSLHSALIQRPLNRVQCCQSAVDAVSTLPDLRRPHVATHPDCVWTCAPMSLTETLITSSPSLCFASQRKRTASCGLSSGRVTRASLCRALSAACPTRWSWLAGERLIVHSTRGKCRDPPWIRSSTGRDISRLRAAFQSVGTVLGRPSLFYLRLKNTIFAPVCPQRSLLAAVAGGCHHEDVWSGGRGADEARK